MCACSLAYARERCRVQTSHLAPHADLVAVMRVAWQLVPRLSAGGEIFFTSKKPAAPTPRGLAAPRHTVGQLCCLTSACVWRAAAPHLACALSWQAVRCCCSPLACQSSACIPVSSPASPGPVPLGLTACWHAPGRTRPLGGVACASLHPASPSSHTSTASAQPRASTGVAQRV